MAIEVETKDCTALSDGELAEMADLSMGSPAGYDIGLLSKAREEWVLVTVARDSAGTGGGKLQGFSFCTLERIGGTPSCLWGLAGFKRNSKRDTVLRGITGDQFRRAVLAFPDEDVLVGTRLIEPSAFLGFKGLEDVCPRPDHKPSGEERAWSRRLAKRFGFEKQIDDRTFTIQGSGSAVGVFDWEAAKEGAVAEDVAGFFSHLDRERGDSIVAFGWAIAEDIASKYGPR